MARSRPRFVPLLRRLGVTHPSLDAPGEAIAGGRVKVDGAVVTNPAARVRADAAVTVAEVGPLQGSRKLAAALDHFGVAVAGRVCVDVGACTGGFTSILVEAGAATVYAVEAGFGQLLGSLRQHPRVVNLERTNLGSLTPVLIPEAVDLVVMDLSYLAVADAVGQLETIDIAPDADLIALVKPMYELRMAELPTDPADLERAVTAARAGVDRGPWVTAGVAASPVRGGRGAVEFLLHARRSA
ncbi:MAG: SAM-dependent methyltransferase [Acidimicrobiales bacterium]